MTEIELGNLLNREGYVAIDCRIVKRWCWTPRSKTRVRKTYWAELWKALEQKYGGEWVQHRPQGVRGKLSADPKELEEEVNRILSALEQKHGLETALTL